MAHGLIIGGTGTGKTTAAINLALKYRKWGIKSIFFTTKIGETFPAHIVIAPKSHERSAIPEAKARLMDTVLKSRNVVVFIDEAGETARNNDDDFKSLATRMRSYGISVFFIAQGYKDVAKTVRNNVEHLYVFRTISETDLKEISNEWGFFTEAEIKAGVKISNAQELILDAGKLKKYNYLYVNRDDHIAKHETQIITG